VPAWSVPVVAHRRLFLRDQQVLLCYDLRQKAPAGPREKPAGGKGGPRQPDAVFVPSPPEVVAKMLEMAGVGKTDVVYDLGCGDGRILVAAARKHGARGVGIELDPALVKLAQEEARKQGAQGLVTIKEGDLFKADLAEATVVALYLLPRLNARLLPKLKGLKAGTRIVSHAFPLDGIRPDKVARFRSEDGLTEHTVYLYVAPLRPQRARD
jgi:SAM-dependent methyltransferase